MTGVIVCGGAISDYAYMNKYFKNAGIVICADSGAFHLRRFDIKPDILLGDCDSIAQEDYTALAGDGVTILKYPVEKDKTDSELAVDLALEKGCSSVVILGALGTRLDHSVSNIFLLKKLLEAGAEGVIADEHNEVRLINSRITIERDGCEKVSLLPLTQRVCGITTKGLYYPLCDASIEQGSSRGVSNEFTGDAAEVALNEGILLVIKSRD